MLKRGKSISQKLREGVQAAKEKAELEIKKNVTDHIDAFFSAKSNELKTGKQGLSIKLFAQETQLKASLLNNEALVQSVPTPDFLEFFLGRGLASFMGTGERIIQKLGLFLQETAKEHNVAQEHASFHISSFNGNVNFSFRQEDNLVCPIDLLTLIQKCR